MLQWLRICPPVQGPWVRSLVQEDSTLSPGHNHRACARSSCSERSRRDKKPEHGDRVATLTAARESRLTAAKTHRSQKLKLKNKNDENKKPGECVMGEKASAPQALDLNSQDAHPIGVLKVRPYHLSLLALGSIASTASPVTFQMG